ncbi:hypothetical protein [Rhodococcus marinonascens]|uniref:hypothetical protein n=1 Tax=Rhodococcus marinonascens TaxID=38311 RepID=UPI001474FC67|nr:hypothetical protein [Rhodococcus marinonascens]
MQREKSRPGSDAHLLLEKVIPIPKTYPAEVREKAVHLVFERRGDYAPGFEA